MKQLHPRVIWLFFFKFLFVGLFLLFFFVGGVSEGLDGLMILGRFVVPFWFFLILIFLVYIALCYIFAKLTYRFWRYELTEDAVKIEKGVIWKKYISIPYGRIQNIDIYRGILARLLGLSDLQIQTAGYSGGQGRYGMIGKTEGKLPGLDPQIAEQLREELTKKARGTRQGL